MEFGKNFVSVGPWGGQGGHKWDDGVYSTVRQVEVAHGAGIDSIKVQYDRNGTPEWEEKHGGTGGAKVDTIRLDYPDEFLTSFHGTYGSLQEWGAIFVRSLTFRSNKRTYGPYGIEEGTFFSFPITQGKIVGFHGKCGWYLDAIGVHLEPLSKVNPSKSIIHTQRNIVHGTESYEYSMMQGNLGHNYDLIVAVRQKGGYSKIPDALSGKSSKTVSDISSRQSSNSSEFSNTEPKNKIVDLVPSAIERIPSKSVQGVMTYGPWGGQGGTVFDDGIYDGIREIHLSRNVAIISIRVCYDRHGEPQWGCKNGSSGAYKYDKIVIKYPNEILTHITGYYGPAMGLGPNVIKSLTFHTTKGKYGPYGEELGQPFSTKLKDGMVVGIHGKKGYFIDAIGVHVLEGKVMPAISSVAASNKMDQNVVSTNEADGPQWSFKLGKKGLMEEAVQKIVKDPAPHGPGPWGGDGGKPWDDGVFTGIKQIVLNRADVICSIEIEYDRNGQSVWSVKHGGNIGSANRIKLDYPHEVLTCISGYYGSLQKDQGTKVIKSLTFHTSRRKFGPFGEELGNFFTSTTTEGKVVGFHGRSGMYLDAIGVHMQHWLGNKRSSKPSSLMKIFH